MHRIDGTCPPGRARHLRYRFMMHLGVEDLFSERYRVHTASPSDWSNPLYDPQVSANQRRSSSTCCWWVSGEVVDQASKRAL